MKNRYDNLNAKLKRERDLINKKNTKVNNKVDALKKKIDKLKYDRDIYCKIHNNTIIDFNSLIDNEVARIDKDYSNED